LRFEVATMKVLFITSAFPTHWMMQKGIFHLPLGRAPVSCGKCLHAHTVSISGPFGWN
jgi:hypothetical protein